MLNMKRAAGRDDIVLVAKGNCGVPKFVDGAIRYDGTPELMAVYARMAIDAGARIVGGCCGTTPQHLRAMRDALEAHTRGAAPTLDEIEARLGEVSRGARAQWQGEAPRQPTRRPRGQRAAPS
jgi:5-methyltetrahydrofolate--homocysteine methyltransferase